MRSSLAILSLWICLNVDATPPIVCPELPKVENAQISPAFVQTSYSPGDKIEYSCDNGYTSLRKIQYVCSENKWTKIREMECTPKRCEQPADILNGKYILQSGNSFVVGTTIKYICNNGFQMMSRIDIRTCRHGGWDNQLPVCEEVVCAADIPDRRIKVEGLLDYGDLMRHGHRLQFSCEQGDILRGHKEIICQSNGEWNHPFPKCEEVACLLNNTEDMKVERIPNQEGLIKPGHQIKLSCVVHGLIIKGKKELTCQADGEWSSPFPKCEEATCVANLTNMIVEEGPDPGVVIYKPGDNLKVSCIQGRGLILQGENSITCREDGEWSSQFPKCVVKTDCERPPTMGHKNADTKQMLDSRKTEYKSGEKVEYTCFNTYTMEGDPYLTCVQGKWEGNFTCIEPCLASVDEMDKRKIQLQKGGRERMYCPHKDHITFVCQRGYLKKIYNRIFRYQCLYGKMTLPECE